MTIQKPEVLYYCKLCGRHNLISRATHKIPPMGADSQKCPGDLVTQAAQSCLNCHYKDVRGCPDTTVVKSTPWNGCYAWCKIPSSSVPSVPSVVNPLPVPTLKGGRDQATAKELIKRWQEAQVGLRRVVSFGLLAWETKDMLPHGQFGPWLAAHCPSLTRVDSKTGIAKPSSSLSSYMELTKGVLESTGFTVEKYLQHISNSQSIRNCHGGKYLHIADKKLSPEALELKTKICNVVDGKTAKQLFLNFKQAKQDASGNIIVKRGRLDGQGGASKLQRDKKQQIDEKARLDEMEIRRAEVTEWLKEVSDDKHLGLLAPDQDFADALDLAAGYLRRLARKTPTT